MVCSRGLPSFDLSRLHPSTALLLSVVDDGWETQMSNDWDPPTGRRSTTMAMIVFAAAFGVHGIDHLRRGMAASPPSIMIGGMIQGLFVVVALVLVLRQHRLASQAATVVGFGSALLFTYAHLLPTFLPGY